MGPINLEIFHDKFMRLFNRNIRNIHNLFIIYVFVFSSVCIYGSWVNFPPSSRSIQIYTQTHLSMWTGSIPVTSGNSLFNYYFTIYFQYIVMSLLFYEETCNKLLYFTFSFIWFLILLLLYLFNFLLFLFVYNFYIFFCL